MKHIMLVMTNAADGADEEFNHWYDEVHLRDVLGQGPFEAAQRFRLADVSTGAEARYRYLAIYEVEDDRLEEARDWILHSRAERAEALAAGRTPLVPISPTLEEERVSWFYTALGDRREAEPAARGGSLSGSG